MTIEQISDAAKQLKKKYDEIDPERLAERMKILVSQKPMGLFEGCCKGFFWSISEKSILPSTATCRTYCRDWYSPMS